MKIISLIIPIYNVEKYIERCLMSCVHQNIPISEYEIIAVNDGTLDNSMVIVERIAKMYSNIRVITQTNQGLSAARNAGTSVAEGEYVWYIDSDDYIEENCLGRITSLLKNDLDILQIQARRVYNDGELIENEKVCLFKGVVSGEQIVKMGGLPAPVPYSIYRRHYLIKNKLGFVEGILHEDAEFKPRVICFAQRIASDNVIGYNYFQRTSDSITSVFKLKNAQDEIKVMNLQLKFCNDNNLRCEYRAYMYRMIGVNMNTLLYHLPKMSKNDIETICEELKANKHLFKCMLKSKRVVYIIEALFFIINVKLGVNINNLLR